jgi:hypothetical protein
MIGWICELGSVLMERVCMSKQCKSYMSQVGKMTLRGIHKHLHVFVLFHFIVNSLTHIITAHPHLKTPCLPDIPVLSPRDPPSSRSHSALFDPDSLSTLQQSAC